MSEMVTQATRQFVRCTKDLLFLRGISFGTPAAIVTGMALIVGLDATTATKTTIIGSLLIIGIADNLTDSLSVHIYQEAELLAQQRAFMTTVFNYLARFVVSFSFIFLFLLLPTSIAIYVCLAWGFFLLSWLSYLLARARRQRAGRDRETRRRRRRGDRRQPRPRIAGGDLAGRALAQPPAYA